jgi:hypothetical protein
VSDSEARGLEFETHLGGSTIGSAHRAETARMSSFDGFIHVS